MLGSLLLHPAPHTELRSSSGIEISALAARDVAQRPPAMAPDFFCISWTGPFLMSEMKHRGRFGDIQHAQLQVWDPTLQCFSLLLVMN